MRGRQSRAASASVARPVHSDGVAAAGTERLCWHGHLLSCAPAAGRRACWHRKRRARHVPRAHQGSPLQSPPAASEKSSEVSAPAWSPQWRVCRNTDALPGQNAGRPIPVTVENNSLAKCKKVCEIHAWGGFVMAGNHANHVVYFRDKDAPDLRSAASPLEYSSLCLRQGRNPAEQDVPRQRANASVVRVVVVATHDEFDETVYFNKEVGTTTAGNGRKFAVHALLRCLSAAANIELAALLILDWKHDGDDEATCLQPLPVEGPDMLHVSVHQAGTMPAWRGTYEQLLVGAAGELTADFAVAVCPRRDVLSLMHGAIAAGRYLVMGHDYQVPLGPWGTRESGPNHELQTRLLEKTTALCTSEHLAAYLRRWSMDRVDARVCYCADYGYFSDELPAVYEAGECVTLISPCPAKGLSVLLRVASELPEVSFLAVSTVWTMTIHEEQIKRLPNIQLVRGSTDVDAIYRRTAVLLMPSLWSEAFGLVALEAQLRGIPVVSTGAYGLLESNLLPELRVPDVRLVSDLRTRTLHTGKTIDELESSLPLDRPSKAATEEQTRRIVAHSHFHVATEEEARGFTERVRQLWHNPEQRAQYGKRARVEAAAFLESRRGRFAKLLAELMAEGDPQGRQGHA